MKDQNKNYYDKRKFKDIFKKIMNSICELKYKDFNNQFTFNVI